MIFPFKDVLARDVTAHWESLPAVQCVELSIGSSTDSARMVLWRRPELGGSRLSRARTVRVVVPLAADADALFTGAVEPLTLFRRQRLFAIGPTPDVMEIVASLPSGHGSPLRDLRPARLRSGAPEPRCLCLAVRYYLATLAQSLELEPRMVPPAIATIGMSVRDALVDEAIALPAPPASATATKADVLLRWEASGALWNHVAFRLPLGEAIMTQQCEVIGNADLFVWLMRAAGPFRLV